MKRQELNQIVGQELEHIEMGHKGSVQNEFRMLYNMVRRRELGRDASAPPSDSLRKAVDAVREHDSEFIPEYDSTYFGE